jgi:DNA replication and repair protein RecF
MLLLKQIQLTRFKNYEEAHFQFGKRLVGIYGKNGAGKTNLLDAIYYICFTRSYFNRQDTLNSRHGTDGFRIQAELVWQDKPETATCILRETGKKEFLLNGQPYEKFSQHIGHYPCVIISPDDARLLTGTSEERRRLIDSLLSQVDEKYLQHLIYFNKILTQRNSFLRGLTDKRTYDRQLLDVLDEQLLAPTDYIFSRRREFLVSFLPKVKHLYFEIAGEDPLSEKVDLFYESELMNAELKDLLLASRPKDLLLQRTTCGIQRDDIDILLNDHSFRNLASQGQRKSMLFALKLAELEVLHKEKRFPPLLLLDDVFEKLDEDRMTNLMEKVCLQNEGQVFITDTNKERLEHYLRETGEDFQLIEIA